MPRKHENKVPAGLELGLPETCANGWRVQQVHILGTGPDVQEKLLEPAATAVHERKEKPKIKGR